MSLAFASGQYVNHGSGAALDDLGATAFSVMALVYRTGDGGNQIIVSKDGAYPSGWLLFVENSAGGEGEVRFIVFRGATFSNATDYISAAGVVPLNRWTVVGVAYADADATKVSLFAGPLGQPLVDLTPSTATNGTGASSTDAAYNCYVGSVQRDTTLTFSGRIARAAVYNRRLSLGEARQVAAAATPEGWVRSGSLFVTDYQTTKLQPDVSGNGRHGTVTGATVAPHPLLPVNRARKPLRLGIAASGGTTVALLAAPLRASPRLTGATATSALALVAAALRSAPRATAVTATSTLALGTAPLRSAPRVTGVTASSTVALTAASLRAAPRLTSAELTFIVALALQAAPLRIAPRVTSATLASVLALQATPLRSAPRLTPAALTHLLALQPASVRAAARLSGATVASALALEPAAVRAVARLVSVVIQDIAGLVVVVPYQSKYRPEWTGARAAVAAAAAQGFAAEHAAARAAVGEAGR